MKRLQNRHEIMTFRDLSEAIGFGRRRRRRGTRGPTPGRGWPKRPRWTAPARAVHVQHLFYAELYMLYTILYYIILYYTVLYYTIPYYTLLYYTILY